MYQLVYSTGLDLFLHREFFESYEFGLLQEGLSLELEVVERGICGFASFAISAGTAEPRGFPLFPSVIRFSL